jgi:RNA:NAD 2'-phosphotransferase (TPT1/KptA family)
VDKTLVATSKFLSLVLRHQPESIGLSLDTNGWADNRDTEQAFGVEFGQFDKLTDGTLLPVATTFSDFLKWCMSKDHG